MTAVASLLRFYVDESALGLGEALTVAHKDTVHAGHPLLPATCRLGADDVEWIPEVASRRFVVFLRDKRVRTRPVEIATLRAAGLRVFWLAGKQDLSTWGYLTRVVNHWDMIERAVGSRGAGPWAFLINSASVDELRIS